MSFAMAVAAIHESLIRHPLSPVAEACHQRSPGIGNRLVDWYRLE